jgi:hypothetical protein
MERAGQRSRPGPPIVDGGSGILLKIFLSSVLLLGLFFAGFGVYFIALGKEAGGWTEVEGQVLSVAIRTDISQPAGQLASRATRESRKSYYPRITYTWKVEGESYTGSRYRLGATHEKFEKRADAEAAAAKFRAGTPIAVFYDAKNPGSAVLVRKASAGVFVPLPLGLLLAAMGWFGLRHIDALRQAMASGDGEPMDLL